MTGAKDIHICYVFIYVSIIIYLFLYLSFYQYLSSFPYLHVSLSIHFRLNLSNPCLFFLSTYTYIYIPLSLYTLPGCIWSLLSLSLSTFMYLYPPFRFYLFVSTYVALHFYITLSLPIFASICECFRVFASFLYNSWKSSIAHQLSS